MRYVGVDLHTNSFTVCYRTVTGKEKLMTYSMSNLANFLEELRIDDDVAVESTGNTRFFVESVQKYVNKVVVIDPNKFVVIKKSSKKTDENDAKAIALFLSKDMVPQARMKTGIHAELSKLVATRGTLVKQRTMLINTVHGLNNACGIKDKKENLTTVRGLNKALETARSKNFNELVILQIEVLAAQVKSLNDGIKKLDEQIEDKGKSLEGHQNVASIKGIGDKAATILMTVIGDINDFSDEGKLASYFGMVPRVSNSNETVHHGRITKQGSKIGRTTIVQCTLCAIRYSPYLKQFYARIKQRRGSGKAIIATARKLLGIVFLTLKNKWVFTDFEKFEYVIA